MWFYDSYFTLWSQNNDSEKGLKKFTIFVGWLKIICKNPKKLVYV